MSEYIEPLKFGKGNLRQASGKEWERETWKILKEVLVEHKRRQDIFKSVGMTYIWWADRERDNLIERTWQYLDHCFFNCKGEKRKLCSS